MQINKRVFVSFDGKCPYNCKHCFSFEIEQPSVPRTVEQIVDSLKGKDFDVVYVSQKKENFVVTDEGLTLCEQIFSNYGCNIVIITRNVFSRSQIERMLSLHKKMRLKGKNLFLGISIIGLKSAAISEDLTAIPTPEERIKFAVTLYNSGIPTLVLIRPLFPQHLIPSEEWKEIVDRVAGNVSCILSGPLMVNTPILKRLGLLPSDLNYLCEGESDYLDGAIAYSMEYVDVIQEMQELKTYCFERNVAFFEHSLPALNYIVNNLNPNSGKDIPCA